MALELRYGLVMLVVGVEDRLEGLVGRMELVECDVVKPPGEEHCFGLLLLPLPLINGECRVQGQPARVRLLRLDRYEDDPLD